MVLCVSDLNDQWFDQLDSLYAVACGALVEASASLHIAATEPPTEFAARWVLKSAQELQSAAEAIAAHVRGMATG